MNTNNGGITYIPAISTGALYVNNKRLRDIILELQTSISLMNLKSQQSMHSY